MSTLNDNDGEPMELPKLCRDCTHYQAGRGGGVPRCLNPELVEVDLVLGGAVFAGCYKLREPAGVCGERGLFWTEIERITQHGSHE